METQNPNKPKFDPVRLITQALSLVKHSRLMLLMIPFGIMAGICYYVYSMPLYMAKSLVYIRAFGATVKDNRVDELRGSGSVLNRFFLTNLTSGRMQLLAAQKLGLVGPRATAEDVLKHVPIVRRELLDTNHVNLVVFAYDKDVVNQFAEALVDEYKRSQEETWSNYRDEALARYAEEMQKLEAKISEGHDAILGKEKDENLTEAAIAQKILMEVPLELNRAKNRLKNFETNYRTDLARLDQAIAQAGDQPNFDLVVEMLSLLSAFEDESEVDVGSVVRSPGLGGRAPLNATAPKLENEVTVVQPQMVEEIEAWRKLDKTRRETIEEIRAKSATYLPDHAVMKELAGRLQESERQLLVEMTTARQRFDLDYAALQEKLTNLEARMPEWYEKSAQYDRNVYDLDVLRDGQAMFETARKNLADKLSAILFNEERDWADIQFKGHIFLRNEVPVSPNKLKLVMLSALIALAGAFGAPILLNMMNTSVATVQELEDYTGLFGIGMVPLASKELLEDVHRSPAQGATVPNFLLETIRVIRSNICLRPNRHLQSQVVMVTSARPQEGKTSQAANLAWAFRSMGEKTLLLDCDLRRGRVHGFTGVSNEMGMTHLLMGDCTPEQAIQSVGHRSSSFDIIPRGPVIAGTTEILCQKRFEDLIALFRQHYDRIVVDTPPVLGLSETSSLQRVCDGVVLVVRAEATSRKDVGDAVTILNKAGAHFFGFVLNAVDLSKASNYYNYYYYSAAYYDDFDDDLGSDGGDGQATPGRIRPGRSPLPLPSGTELGPRHTPAI